MADFEKKIGERGFRGRFAKYLHMRPYFSVFFFCGSCLNHRVQPAPLDRFSRGIGVRQGQDRDGKTEECG